MASTVSESVPTSASVGAIDTDRLDSVQILRGVAAMAVVFNHAAIWLVHDPSIDMPRSLLAPIPAFAEFGGFGVDLFFVISGFVMTLGAGRFAGRRGALMFLAQRFVRVAPLFYLFSLVMLAVMLVGGQRIDPMSRSTRSPSCRSSTMAGIPGRSTTSAGPSRSSSSST